MNAAPGTTYHITSKFILHPIWYNLENRLFTPLYFSEKPLLGLMF
jgi:hypothetical protein